MVAPLLAYYALPVFVVIISLGEICPYSPSGTSLCRQSASVEPGLRPAPQTSSALRRLGTLAFAASAGSGSTPDIFVINVDGTGLANLTRSESADDRSPAWSPDGTTIAFSSDGGQAHGRDLEVVDVRSRAVRNLTKGAGANYDPAWSPDGQQIAFASERTDDATGQYDDHFEIYVRRRDAEVAKLTHNDADDLEPVWSPNGAMIAFSSKRDGNWEIYVMNAAGSAQKNLSENRADDEQPAWSPDGTKIAFVSNRAEGLEELYVMNPDGTDVRRLTNIPTGKSRPTWSPDGGKIAFINPADQGIYLMNADGSQMRKLLAGVEADSRLAWQPTRNPRSTPTAAGRPAGLPPLPSPARKLCKKAGIRYAGTTPQGTEVCLTLTVDRSKWLEIGFRLVRANGCPHTTGTTYYEGRVPLNGPGRISVPGFTASIRGARASGVLGDSDACGSKTFKWSAKRIVGA